MPPQKTQNSFITRAATLPLYRQRQHLLLFQLLLLSIAASCAFANPVSSPEIASKSNQQLNLVNGGVNQQLQQQQHQHQQQQHQQQQQQTLKSNSQEPQLNTLSAYAAANYDGFSEVDFRPSYKLPDMETNFTPIQSGVNLGTSTAHSAIVPNPTPVIMQYLAPQQLQDGGVQYLQLIPTRPLILPISPYMTPQTAPAPYHQTLTAENSIGEYANRSPTVLNPIHANSIGQPTSSTLLNVQSSHLPYGLHTYANAIQPYRTNYRINREIKDKPAMPMGLTLNLNEYIPGPRELPHHLYVRGRP